MDFKLETNVTYWRFEVEDFPPPSTAEMKETREERKVFAARSRTTLDQRFCFAALSYHMVLSHTANKYPKQTFLMMKNNFNFL